jgi:hypothetical protein
MDIRGIYLNIAISTGYPLDNIFIKPVSRTVIMRYLINNRISRAELPIIYYIVTLEE